MNYLGMREKRVKIEQEENKQGWLKCCRDDRWAVKGLEGYVTGERPFLAPKVVIFGVLLYV